MMYVLITLLQRSNSVKEFSNFWTHRRLLTWALRHKTDIAQFSLQYLRRLLLTCNQLHNSGLLDCGEIETVGTF